MSDQSSSRAGRCPSNEQLLALASMAPGQIPGEVAVHLASCERCQRRALFGAPQPATQRSKEAPSLRGAFLRVGLVLVVLAMALLSIRIVLG